MQTAPVHPVTLDGDDGKSVSDRLPIRRKPRPGRRFPEFVRYCLKWAWIWLLYATGCLYRAKRKIADRDGVVVLAFHRVLTPDMEEHSDSPQGMIVSQETFEALIRHVSQSYFVLDLGTGNCNDSKACKGPRIAFTFDDGWADTLSLAYPIARKYNVPLTIFVCPGILGKESPFWPEAVIEICRAAAEPPEKNAQLAQALGVEPGILIKAVKGNDFEAVLSRLKPLESKQRSQVLSEMMRIVTPPVPSGNDAMNRTLRDDEIRTLARSGVSFGSHTYSHQILPYIPAKDAEQELVVSKQSIQQLLGTECRLFAYPNGDSSSEVCRLVEKSGYDYAFTVSPGYWVRETDQCRIPRLNVWEGRVTGLAGQFSALAFEYTIFWKAYRGGTHTRDSLAKRVHA
jgi:peptidoglycan/xylan/chitin deacetylase (PgdA/CDA1 family)